MAVATTGEGASISSRLVEELGMRITSAPDTLEDESASMVDEIESRATDAQLNQTYAELAELIERDERANEEQIRATADLLNQMYREIYETYERYGDDLAQLRARAQSALAEQILITIAQSSDGSYIQTGAEVGRLLLSDPALSVRLARSMAGPLRAWFSQIVRR